MIKHKFDYITLEQISLMMDFANRFSGMVRNMSDLIGDMEEGEANNAYKALHHLRTLFAITFDSFDEHKMSECTVITCSDKVELHFTTEMYCDGTHGGESSDDGDDFGGDDDDDEMVRH